MNIKRLAILSLFATLPVIYQNCSPVSFGNGGGGAVSLDQVNGSSTTPDPGSGDTPAPSENGDAYCLPILGGAAPAIAYDSLPAGNGASVDFTNGVQASIQAETIGAIGNFSTVDLAVKARTIQDFSNFSAQNVGVNAASLLALHDFSAQQVAVVAHQLPTAANFSAFLCASVQTVGALHDLSGSVSLYGRLENGQRATLGALNNLSGYVSLHNFEVPSFNAASVHMSLDNSHIQQINSASGEIYLNNSVIDSVSNFAGKIHLKGTSSVGQSNSSSVQIIQE